MSEPASNIAGEAEAVLMQAIKIYCTISHFSVFVNVSSEFRENLPLSGTFSQRLPADGKDEYFLITSKLRK